MADKEKWKGRAYPHGLAHHKKNKPNLKNKSFYTFINLANLRLFFSLVLNLSLHYLFYLLCVCVKMFFQHGKKLVAL